MAYTINLTDGSLFTTVADGTINTDSSLTIVGKNYAGYGEFLGENFLKLLENSSNTSAPTDPLIGQLWYDNAAGLLKVYNGSTWKNLGAASSSGSAPTSNVVGDLWFDTVNSQLKVWDGANFILIGPAFTVGTGTSGSIVDTITDNVAVDHVVVKLYVEDDIVGIISKDPTFTPATTIPGFTTINPGIHLASTVNGQIPLFEGTAREALNLVDSLGNQIDVDGFLRSTVNDATIGTLGVLNDGGLTVGADQDGTLNVVGNDVFLTNNTINGDILLKVNDGGVPITVLTINGTTGRATLNAPPTVDLGVATKKYVDDAITTGSGGALLQDGSNQITGTILPASNVAYDFGGSSNRFATIHADTFQGRATTAKYADLAERFEADALMVVGTVVELGGIAEITEALGELTDSVLGVISTNPGFLMNEDAGNAETHPAVAMSGRVPVRVTGIINKGDRLVSAGAGLARSASPAEITPFNVLGRALEAKTTTGEGVIEAIVTVK